MSSGGQILGGVVGAVIGFYVGGPVGALQGAALGAGIGAALDPPKGPTVEGPRLNDLKVQTSTLGQGIPRFYGTIGVAGNIIWLENNQLKETVRKEKQGGGKGGGGGSQTVKTYSYSATFALCLGEGPISGIRRIWCSDKLIYNAGSDDLETIIASNRAAAGMRFYYGTEDQLPDPRIEAEMGVGNAPAFRGRVYIVFDDFQLADYSNTLQAAQFKVEVVSDGEIVRPASRLFTLSVMSDTFYVNAEFDGSQFIVSRHGPFKGSFGWVDGYIQETYNLSGIRTSVKTINYSTGMSGSRSHQVSNSGREIITNNYSGSDLRTSLYRDGVSYAVLGEGTAVFRSNFAKVGDVYYCVFYQAASTVVRLQKRVIREQPFPIGRTLYVEGTNNSFSTSSDSTEVSIVASLDGRYLCLQAAGLTSAGTGPVSVLVLSATDFSVVSYRSAVNSIGTVIGFNDNGVIAYSSGVISVYNPLNMEFKYSHSNTIAEITGYQGRAALFNEMAFNGRSFFKMISPLEVDDYPLSTLIREECAMSSLISESDVDTSLIADGVPGYVIAGGTIRSALEPLQAAYPFDVITSGYTVKCVPRGQSSVSSIPMADLGATDSGSLVDLLAEQREMDTQLPAKTVIKYIDADREYDQSEQQAERINTQAVNKVERELPIVMAANKAAGVAEVLQSLAWLERNDFSFRLPPKYSNLESSDVVTVQRDGATYELLLRSTKYQQGGVIECSAKLNRAALYTPVAEGGEVPGGGGSIPLPGASLAVLMDIPVVDESVQNSNGFTVAATGYTAGWPGALLVRTADSGQTFTDIQGFTGKGTIGTARGILPASNATIIDGRTLTVDLISGSLSSITRDQMLNGAHYVAYGADGRWEIVRFQNATQNSDGSYAVSGFVRGEKGTEWATGLHQSGDWFVLLDDPDNAFIGMSAETIGSAFTYRAVTSGDSVDDADNLVFTYRGVNLECLSPVYAYGTRDGSSNFGGSFTRRSRLTGTWWTTGTQTPVGETSEAYEIDVINGSTVVRTISVTSPSFSYSAAEQAADFGSAQSSIKFRIYQMSGIVGRGYPLEVTL